MGTTSNIIPFNEGSFLDSRHVDEMFKLSADIHRGWGVKAALSRLEFQKHAAIAAKVEYRCFEGWNEEDYWLEIAPESYYYWAQREPDCWSNRIFRAQYARDNPECVRRNVTGNTVITRPTPAWELGRAIRAAMGPCLVEEARAKAA